MDQHITYKEDSFDEKLKIEIMDEKEKQSIRQNMGKFFKRANPVENERTSILRDDDKGEIPSKDIDPYSLFTIDEEDGEIDYLEAQKAYDLSVFLDSHKFIKNKKFDKPFVNLVKRQIIRFERNLVDLVQNDKFFILYEVQMTDEFSLCLTEIVALNAIKSVLLAYPSVHLVLLFSDEELFNEEREKYYYSFLKELAEEKLKNILIYLNFEPEEEKRIHALSTLQLKEKTLLLLGNEQGNNNIKKIEKSFELVNMKYKNDYNSYIKDLKSKLIDINKETIPLNIKLRCNNLIYFLKSINNNQDSINKFMKENCSVNNMNKYKKYFEFIDYLYGYKNSVRILTIKYKEETEKLKNSIISILNDEINNQKNIINDRIDKYNYKNRKKQMELIHQKNVEIYNNKEKIKREENEFEEKMKKRKEEEKKKKENLRQLINKERVKIFNDEKNIQQQKINENIKMEEEIRRNKQKKEYEKRLPYIINSNIISQNKFLKNQKQKYIDKAIAEENERRLNEIIENYKCRPKIEADEKRLNSITQNLENRYRSINKKTDLDEKVELFSHNGFTVEQLMKDFRYKVSSALYEAGLSNKLATQDALRNISLQTSPLANNQII